MRPGVFRTLWRRAPAWRALFYLACLLTIIVVFLPNPGSRTHAAWQETASFAPTPYSVREPLLPRPLSAQPPPVLPAAAQGPSTADIPNATAKEPAVSLGPPSTTLPDNDAPPVSTDVGKVYNGSYTLHGRALPLLPGEWTVLAKITTSRDDGDLETAFLGRIVGEKLQGATVFLDYANFRTSWGAPFKGCTDPFNLVSTVEVFESQGRQACWTIRNVFSKAWHQWRDRNIRFDPLVRAAVGQLDVKGVDYPQDMLQVLFHQADGGGTLNAVYYFNPNTEGLSSSTQSTWQHSDWTPQNIGRFADKVVYEKRTESWARAWWPKVKKVFALPRQ